MWIIDAFNVLGARPDGWWHDRSRALEHLVDTIRRWRPADVEVLVGVDGWPDEALPEGSVLGVGVRYAHRRGPDAADAVIADLVRAGQLPPGTTVVTSDRALREIVRAHGVEVEGAGTFRRRVEGLAPPEGRDRPESGNR